MAQHEAATLQGRLEGAESVRRHASSIAQRSSEALAFLEGHAGERVGSQKWFERHVAREEELARNASTDEAMAREAKDATQAILVAVNHNISALIVRRSRLTAEQARLKSALAGGRAAATQAEKEAASSSRSMQATLAAEHSVQTDLSNALAEVDRRHKLAKDVQAEADRRAQEFSAREGELRIGATEAEEIESEKQKQDDLKNSIGQEQQARLIAQQSANDLAAEVERLRSRLQKFQGEAGSARAALIQMSTASAEMEGQLHGVETRKREHQSSPALA